jgi:hypothetical protein
LVLVLQEAHKKTGYYLEEIYLGKCLRELKLGGKPEKVVLRLHNLSGPYEDVTIYIWQLDWATGCPGMWLNIISGCAHKGVSRKD